MATARKKVSAEKVAQSNAELVTKVDELEFQMSAIEGVFGWLSVLFDAAKKEPGHRAQTFCDIGYFLADSWSITARESAGEGA
ncbi:MAG: hypothetical protein ABIQ70_07015 [Dokdonella sp.]